MAGGARLDNDPLFPARAEDWKSGQESSAVVFRQGKWWYESHWNFWGKNLKREQARIARNEAFRAFLRGQTTDPGL